jgi:hypothetical protein
MTDVTKGGGRRVGSCYVVLLFWGEEWRESDRRQAVRQSVVSPFLLAGDQLTFLQPECLVTPERSDSMLLTGRVVVVAAANPVSLFQPDTGLSISVVVSSCPAPLARSIWRQQQHPQRKAGVPQQQSGCEAQIVLRGGTASFHGSRS